jgi:hypothetical protein
MRIRARSILFGAATIGAGACITDDPVVDESEVESALELENGGFDFADEAPMFDKADLFAGAELEADGIIVDDFDPATDVVMRDIRDRPGARAHRVILMWGQLPPDRRPERAKIWNGAFNLSRGGMVVRRTIGFEDRDDVLERRTDRNTVAIRSVTKPFSDGLLLTVYDPEPGNPLPLSLAYSGVAGDYRLNLDDLANGPVVIEVDDLGNKIVAMAMRRDAANDNDPCDRGFMRGRWHQLRPHLGVFVGVVGSADGDPRGHVRGIYGVRRNGEHVFFGKFIDRDGRFRGIMRGHYRDGEFAGRWVVRSGDHGRLHGFYRDRPDDDRLGGAWAARWAETSCAQDLRDDI